MKLFSKLKAMPKKVYAFLAVAAIASAAVALPMAIGAQEDHVDSWGPDRPTYAYNEGHNVGSTTGPVFNSFTGVPSYGDERNFTTVSRDGITNWSGNIKVNPGDEFYVRAYVHNNANVDTNGANFDGIGVARDTRVRIYIPSEEAKGINVASYVSASNTAIPRVYDSANVTTDAAAFSLSYVPGTAKMYNYAKYKDGVALPDSVVANSGNGALIGYNALDGNLPGCFDYRATVIVKVKVNAPAMTLKKQVTTPGSSNWTENLVAKTGDTVSWLLTYKNTGTSQMNNVVIRDIVPKDVTVVPGSIVLIDSNHKAPGLTLPDDVLYNGANVGAYAAGATGYIKFRTVVKKDPSVCTIKNVAYAKADNVAEVTDDATVTVEDCKPVTPPAPSYACTLLDISAQDRTVTVTKFETTAANGATFKNATLNWSDNTEALTTNTVVGQKHTYAKDGKYTITATANFTVNGETKSATSQSCSKTITFTPNEQPKVLAAATVMPKTGASEVAIATAVVLATVLGTIGHAVISNRR